MELVIGGYSQGKLNYVLNNYDKNTYQVYDGASLAVGTLEKIATENKVVILNHFHCWVKERIRQGEDPESEIMDFLDQRVKDLVIISDEIGNGIVPMDAFEREYRERTGRILVMAAKRADKVVRIICGIGQRIK